MPNTRKQPLILALSFIGVATLYACGGGNTVTQAALGTKSVNKLSVDGFQFKDLNKNGKLDVYEDWRKTPADRAKDLVAQMTVAEKAGAMMHGTAPTTSTGYDLASLTTLLTDGKVNTFITRLSLDTQTMADQYNQMQEVAEGTRLGIPVSLSTDPRNHFQYTAGASVASGSFSKWPETLGMAAIGDAALTKRFGDIARQEYLAVGITQALSPQADLATDPRWARTNGTFGEDADLAKKMVQAYIEGFQNGSTGLHKDSVVAVVKHWAGYGAAKDGWDSHSAYGKYITFPGNNFAYHLKPFEGAFAANAGSVMPTYSMPDAALTYDGINFEQVGAGFSKQMLTDLLRTKMGFKGVVLSDWAITEDCNSICTNGAAAGTSPSFANFGTPWGVENLTKAQRYVKAVNAGMDQFGGVTDSSHLINAVTSGSLTEARLGESAYRVMLQKFQQGLFENPYVDSSTSVATVGNASFLAEALDAQRKALVLLENKNSVLPLAATVKKVYLYGVEASVASQYGLTVVATPEQADVAIVRVNAPYETLHPGYIFGTFQHEGSLAYADGNADYEAIKAASAKVPTIVTVYLDRPAILTNVRDKAAAILGNFGVSDVALFDVLTGKAKPQGKLPFELPSSMAEVEAQLSDVPHDTAHPLYPVFHGLAY
ncbi:beta-glucosidase [Rhodoferax sp. OV413]|uniref:glycoside hydrolase family 3 protein n=1 Tax=Rhodoferax sp. OV413 TaxID=1855285 RepID=UPI000887A21C|nr:glycoside hydrolase family 3 N-terminal domain-containing protein [Rhodoferax sp. OV413]SDO28379.1 beta-glucosidase [Rhodoferax sp. OV413]